MILPPKNTYAQ